jgi:hypothetical protein
VREKKEKLYTFSSGQVSLGDDCSLAALLTPSDRKWNADTVNLLRDAQCTMIDGKDWYNFVDSLDSLASREEWML